VEGRRRRKRKEREERNEKKKGKWKKSKKKGKREKEEEMGKRKRKELGKILEKFRGIFREIWGKGEKGFCGVFGLGRLRDFGTAVMARRTGRQDRGVRRIPGVVADSGARAVGGGVTARVRAVPAGFAARAPRVREGERPGFRKGVNELSGMVLKHT
jgi:hypothetical protein